MPDEVYRPPQSALAMEGPGPELGPPASIDVGLALSDGWWAMLGNFPLWLGAGILWYLLTIGSAMTGIGIVLLIPIFLWGGLRCWLAMFDGRGQVSDLFSGFSGYLRVLRRMLGLLVLTYLIAAPGTLLQLRVQGDGSDPGALVLSFVIGMVWGLVIVRFYPAWFFAVDRDMRVVESLRASWRYTRGQWLKLVLIGLVALAVSAVGVVALVIGVIPAAAVVGFMYVSAYRQMTGTREPAWEAPQEVSGVA